MSHEVKNLVPNLIFCVESNVFRYLSKSFEIWSIIGGVDGVLIFLMIRQIGKNCKSIVYSPRERRNEIASLLVRGEGNVTFSSPLTSKLADDFGNLSVNIV